MKKKHQNFGFSLTEMIIVITIFILIVLSVYSVYFLSQRGYLEGENLAEITQNGRVILERMDREIRQAKEIVTDLPGDETGSPSEIIFQDGHFPWVSEENTAQGGGDNTITLASTASTEDDYYKDMFILITGDTRQIRKIIDYDGTNRGATVDSNWDTNPISGSEYKIDSSFYYIRYYRDADNNILRKVFTYCYSEDSVNCVEPETYVPWDATPQLVEIILEEPRIIGEYVTNLEFWGSGRVINISLTLEKGNRSTELKTKVFGRNL